jgi:histidinol-phosphate aminotransferase
MSLLDLARPEILALKPYSSARMEAGGAAVMLNANESPWPSTGDAGLDLNRYPDPQPAALRTRLAALYGVREEQLLMGRGSDEAIDLLARAFCRPGIDVIAVCAPTFGMYAVCAAVQGANVVEVPLRDDFSFDAEATLAALTPTVKLVFLCSPNNPTGGLIPLVEIERVANALEGRALVIVDEAYIEFAEAGSAATLLKNHANLGVLRTLSKAWALAGARVGMLLAHPDVVRLLRKIMPPYPLPTPCVAAALAALDDELAMRDRVARILSERGRIAAALVARREVHEVLPSRANFLCVRFDDAAAVYRALLAQGVVVRDVGHQRGLHGCLRITIGSIAENTRLLQALDAVRVAA